MPRLFNPSDPDTLGLEWLVTDEPSTFVLDSAAKAFGVRIPGEAGRMSQSLPVWAHSVSGQGRFGCELYSAPYVESIPQTIETRYAGTDTGADFASPTNGNAAWLTQAGGAATYASVSPGIDDTTYLRNLNQLEGPAPARLMMRGANTTQLAGRRILSLELHVRIKCTLASAPTIAGALNLSGIDYVAQGAAVPIGQGYVDMTLGLWTMNPATGKPWTLPEVNNLLTAGATDEFGCLVSWDARYTTNYADTIRISAVYLKVRWQPEDRCGYASGVVDAAGWHTWDAKSVPNLLTKQDSNLDVLTGSGDVGSWVADANTTITNSTDDPGLPWTRSLSIDPTSSGACGAKPGYTPVIAGQPYAFRGFAKWTSGRPLVLSVEFYDPNDNLLQTSAGPSDNGTGSYKATGMTATATAPVGATKAKLHVVMTAGAGTDTLFITGMFFGLAQSALTFVQDSYPGGLAKLKVDGGAEVNEIAHPLDELRLWRRLGGTGAMSLVTFGPGASAAGMPLGYTSFRPMLQDAAGALLTLGGEGTDTTAFASVSLHDFDAANGPIGAYSQPYARRISGDVDTSNTVQSELTLPVETYLVVRLVVSAVVDPPDAALTIALKRRSDDGQVGGVATIGPTDLVAITPQGGQGASRTTPQVFVAAFATPDETTAVQHYLEFSSTATAGAGWRLWALDTMGYTGDSVSIDTVAFGAGIDAWTNPADGGEQTRRNQMVVVQTIPAAPTGLTASIVGRRARLAWDATSLGGQFAALELERYDDHPKTGGWWQIADLRDEATEAWYDSELRRGVPTWYRFALRRVDGARSEYSTVAGPVTVPVDVDGCDEPTWWFTSNEISVDAHVAALDLSDEDVWGRPNRDVEKEFFGRDGAVVFKPLEDPLDEFPIEAVLYWANNRVQSFLQDPPAPGRAAFDPLIDLARASLSYVCVLDDEGGRWFASLSVSEPTRGRRGANRGRYSALVRVRETHRIPSTPIL